MKGLHLQKPKYEQKTGLTCYLPGKNISGYWRKGTKPLSLLEDSSARSMNEVGRPYEQKQYTKFCIMWISQAIMLP